MVKKRKLKKKRIISLIVVILMIFSIIYFSNLIINSKTTNKEKTINKVDEVIEPIEKRMSLVAVGDSLIHGAVYLDASLGNNSYDFSSMFTYIEPIIKNYDLRYYNQESIIGGKNLGISHYPLLNSPDEIGDALVNIGFNMVSLANNHSLDKGTKGLLYSTNYWKQKNIVINGTNTSKEEREAINVYEQNGIKYAFLAYTTATNGLIAAEDYYVNVYDKEIVKQDIDKVKDKVDVIIVSMHWGEEYTHTPTQSEKEIAQYLSSLGVNLIIGSHPHVIQPIDYINDTLVIYSLGNFISAQHPLGLEKIIGLLVGVEIVVNEEKVTFENLNYQLLYTYCTSYYKNFSVIPFSELNDNILNNYKSIEQEYLKIVTTEVVYD